MLFVVWDGLLRCNVSSLERVDGWSGFGRYRMPWSYVVCGDWLPLLREGFRLISDYPLSLSSCCFMAKLPVERFAMLMLHIITYPVVKCVLRV